MNKFLYIIFFYLNLAILDARVITLDEALKLAIENNLYLKNARLKEDFKRSQDLNSWNIFLPDLTFSSTYSNSSSKESNSLGVDLKGGLTFKAGNFKKMELYSSEYIKAQIDREYVERDIKLDVKKTYNGIISLKESLKLSKEHVKNSKYKYEQALIAYNNGLISEIDLYDIQLKWQKSIPELNESEILLDQSMEKFKILLGLDLDEELELEENLINKFLNFSFPESVNISNLRKIVEINHSIKKSDIAKSETFWSLFPYINLGFSYIYTSPKPKIGPESSANFSVSLNFNLSNLIPWSLKMFELRERELENLTLKNNKQQTIKEVYSEILNKQKEVKKLESILDASLLNLELAKKNYSLALNSFNQGIISFSKLNDIEESYRTTNLKLIKDKLNLINAILEYKYLINIED